MMTYQAQQILKKALGLPPIERAELIEKVFDSFSDPQKNNFDRLWAKEAESRIDAFEKGKLKAINAKKVFQKIEKFK
ncbi:MAG: addiction module protein [Candidatus Omnitrophota bacterium]